MDVNRTNSWSIGSSGRILYEYLPFNFLAIFPNAFIIFLSLKSPLLRTHSKYLIANTALLDMGYAASSLVYGFFYSICYAFDIRITVVSCTLFHILRYFFAIGATFSYISTTLCRYREVRRSKTCTKTQVCFSLFYPYTGGIPFLITYWILADSQKPAYGFCKILHSSKLEPIHILLGTVWLFVSFVVQMVLSLKIYRHLRLHFKTNLSVTARSNKKKKNALEWLKTERSILNAILIQGLAPIVLCVPIVILLSSAYFLNYDSHRSLLLGISARNATEVLFHLNPLVDSWAVLFRHDTLCEGKEKFHGPVWEKTANSWFVQKFHGSCSTVLKQEQETCSAYT